MKKQNEFEPGIYRGHYEYSNAPYGSGYFTFELYAKSPEDAEQRLKDITRTGFIDGFLCTKKEYKKEHKIVLKQ